ncbi:CheR family methyltransferase [Pseudooceanicola sediminis]|nr:CheR family methyltransferase [Pseudooceanicola sediminis]|tara:strand:+ start:1787 stop:4339 length:2553 start_codon:yes stop_codon:yes gene_type:complete
MPVIAIGASAGGLEPLEEFFRKAPDTAGWSFVIVQHLSPDYRSMMDELLGRCTKMRIAHIQDGMELTPNTVFLNRPNTAVTLEGSTLRVRCYDAAEPVPLLPIDVLFHSLSTRSVEHTFAVILSGSGSDGTRGAKAFHTAGGSVFVQSPEEATFSSMPKSALMADAVDRVLVAAEIPDAIRGLLHKGGKIATSEAVLSQDSAQSILELLERVHHVDFSAYKAPNVLRRIERRRHLRGIETIEGYRDLLSGNPNALDELYQDLLIGVTEFYRDPDSIRVLRTKTLDALVAQSTEESSLRVWVPACASGEEAYTIAIELSEALRAAGIQRKFRIIATDVHRRSIDLASAGIFPSSAVQKVPPALLERYFARHRDQYVIDPVLRQKIVFSVHDVLSDPPFMQLDLISCRNLMIYMNDDSQNRMISMFLFGLRKEGYLLLGPSESLGRYADQFNVISSRWRLFQNASSKRVLDRSILSGTMHASSRIETNFPEQQIPPRRPLPPAMLTEPVHRSERDNLIRSYDALLKRYAPSSILITTDGTVLAWFGSASAYIDTMNNLAEWTVEDIVHPDLHFTINVGIERLRQGQTDSYARSIAIDMANGEKQRLTIKVEPLELHSKSRFLLVGLKREDIPEDTAAPGAAQARTAFAGEDHSLLSRRIQELERDLRLTEETLQHVTERLEASGEELQASNEELQASNEELQASNEELQSSNEELHAVNEELVSVSAEHERKIELLSELNRDTEVILDILRVGVIVLDDQLRIRRFSHLIGTTFQLEAHDIDRTLGVVGPRPDFVDLATLVRDVLETGDASKRVGDYDGSTLEIGAFPFDRQTEDVDQKGVVLLFSGTGVFE